MRRIPILMVVAISFSWFSVRSLAASSPLGGMLFDFQVTFSCRVWDDVHDAFCCLPEWVGLIEELPDGRLNRLVAGEPREHLPVLHVALDLEYYDREFLLFD